MGDFLDALREMGDAVRRGNFSTELNETAINEINEEVQEVNPPKLLGEIKIVKNTDTGKYEMKSGDKTINGDKLKIAIDNNDIGEIFKELGAPDELFKTEQYITYEKKAEEDFKNDKSEQDKLKLEENSKNKTEIEKRYGKIDTQEDFKNLYKSNKNFRSFVDDIVNRSNEDYKKNGSTSTRGNWLEVKAILFTTAFSVVGFTIFDVIENHANEMSGCFLTNTGLNNDGKKCKVNTLTCNKDDTNACKASDDCTICSTPITGCLNKDNNDVICFDYGSTDSPTRDPTCLHYKSAVCDQYLLKCTDGDLECKACSCSEQSCPKNHDLVCVKASFGDGFADYFNKFLNLFLNILKIVGLVIIVAIVIFILFKFIGWLIKRGKSNNKVITITST